MPGAVAHAAYQRSPGSFGRIRVGGAEAAGKPEGSRECAGRRDQYSPNRSAWDGGDLP